MDAEIDRRSKLRIIKVSITIHTKNNKSSIFATTCPVSRRKERKNEREKERMKKGNKKEREKDRKKERKKKKKRKERKKQRKRTQVKKEKKKASKNESARKKTKNGPAEHNIHKHIRAICFCPASGRRNAQIGNRAENTFPTRSLLESKKSFVPDKPQYSFIQRFFKHK